MALSPPTSSLPPIRQIANYPRGDLTDALKFLRLIYNPEVRGSRRCRSIGSNANPKGISRDDELDGLRSDAFERSYAIKWLTTLVSQAEHWRDGEGAEALLQDAASLLAICSGTAAAGMIVRDFVFDTGHERHGTLRINLTDVPLDNHDYGSVGGQTWGGACVLAEDIAKHPERFGFLHPKSGGLRILELGAGTGLVSLVVGKLFEGLVDKIGVTIVATDYYPSVLTNLEANVRSNFPSDTSNHIRISTHTLDWSTFPNELDHNSPLDEPFDIILGADIIYESQHATWIKSCLHWLLRKPSDGVVPEPTFHLIIPLRRTHSSESSTVETVFPSRDLAKSTLGIMSKEMITCEAENGIGQVEYAYYVIGWC